MAPQRRTDGITMASRIAAAVLGAAGQVAPSATPDRSPHSASLRRAGGPASS